MNTIMADPYPIRPITADEYASFRRVHEHAFNCGPLLPGPPGAGTAAVRAGRGRSPRSTPRCPPAETVVGTTGVYSLRMTVPGAVLPVAGVTAVSVLPSHRRRGVLRSLMHRQLADIAARGEEPVAALWAVGNADLQPLRVRARVVHRVLRVPPRRGRARRARARRPRADAAARRARGRGRRAGQGPRRRAAGQPGFFARDDDWWGRVLYDESRSGRGRGRCAACSPRTAPGCAATPSTSRANAGTTRRACPTAALLIRELVAADPAAGAALWQNLLDRDLVASVTADLRPADDPVLLPAARPAPGARAAGATGFGYGSSTCPRRCPGALLLPGRRGARGHRRAAARQRRALAAARRRCRAARAASGRTSPPTWRSTSASSARPT